MTGPTIINYGTVNVNSGVSTTGGARGGRAGRGGRGGGGGKRGRGSGRLGGCAGVGPKNAPKVKKKTKTEEEKKRPATPRQLYQKLRHAEMRQKRAEDALRAIQGRRNTVAPATENECADEGQQSRANIATATATDNHIVNPPPAVDATSNNAMGPAPSILMDDAAAALNGPFCMGPGPDNSAAASAATIGLPDDDEQVAYEASIDAAVQGQPANSYYGRNKVHGPIGRTDTMDIDE